MTRQRLPCVYILASRPRGTLDIGVTSDLPARIYHHKNDLADGFTKRHRIHNLAWHEVHDEMESAVRKEKALKAWKRTWKIELIDQPGMARSPPRYPVNNQEQNGFQLALE